MIKNKKPLRYTIIVGDIHFGDHSNSDEWFKITTGFFLEFLIPIIEAAVLKFGKDNVSVLFVGDLNDSKTNVSVVIQNKQIDLFKILASHCDCYVMVGNHDMPYLKNPTINSLKSLGLIEGVEVIEIATDLEIQNGEKLRCVPYINDPALERATILEHDCQFVASHAEYCGFFYNGVAVSENRVHVKELSKFKKVFNGHIHKRQEIDNVLNVGTYHLDVADSGNLVGVDFVDFVDCKTNFIENTWSPKFVDIGLFQLLDMDLNQANTLINNNFVSVIYPSELVYEYDFSLIYKALTGFRTLSISTIKSRITPKELVTNNEEMDHKTIDVRLKIIEMIESIDKIKVDKNFINLDDKIRKELVTSVDKLYNTISKRFVESD